MKLIALSIRTGISLIIAFAASMSAAVIYFDYSGYENAIDRFMLVTVPTLAIGYLLFEVAPKVWAWLKERNKIYIAIFVLFATLASVVTVFPVGTSRVYLLGAFAYTCSLLALILPAVPTLEKFKHKNFPWHYLFSFLISFVLLYILLGFTFGAISSKPHFIVVIIIWGILCNISFYYLIRHFAWSRKHGFLRKGINFFLVLILPFFVMGMFYTLIQFPNIFYISYFQIPSNFFDIYLSSIVVASAWSILVVKQFEKRGMYQAFRNTKAFAFIKENIFGIYAGGIFFFINLMLARTFNNPNYSLNSVIFEADAGPWLAILGYPEGYNVNRAVHPLALITIRQFVRFIGLFMGDAWYLASYIGVALTNAFAILMAWIFIKRATKNETLSFLFSTLLGASASHLIFGSLTETYVFGMASLIFFLLLVQADEKRFSVLVPAGLLVFGITITNIAQSMIALFFKKIGFWRLFYYGVLVLTLGIASTAFVNVLYPGNQSSFWVPEDILFEAQFSKPIHKEEAASLVERTQIVGRTMFLYSILAPTPIEAIRGRNTSYEIVTFKTYHYKDKVVAWYNDLANIPLVIWIFIFITALILFIKNFRTDENTPLLWGILGGIAFNFILHMNYGTELFLYTPYFTFLVVFFVALSLKPLAEKRWFEVLMTFFLIIAFANNTQLVDNLLTGLMPYLGVK